MLSVFYIFSTFQAVRLPSRPTALLGTVALGIPGQAGNRYFLRLADKGKADIVADENSLLGSDLINYLAEMDVKSEER